MKKVWSMFMLLAVCLVACTNIDDLEDDVDALKKRVTALETQVRDINSNTEALHFEQWKNSKSIYEKR